MVVNGHVNRLARTDGNSRDGIVAMLLAAFDNLDLLSPEVMKINVEEHEQEIQQAAAAALAAKNPILIFVI